MRKVGINGLRKNKQRGIKLISLSCVTKQKNFIVNVNL